jgi:predicted nuclease with TOPRIM domain
MASSRLRREMLDLLERDLEFRYAVAGYLGISEMLKRLDSLEENMTKLWEEVKALREGQNKLWEEVKGIHASISRMSSTLERLTLSVEDEARSVIKHRIKQDLNIDMELDRVFVDEREINIYGANKDLCVIGEATVRLGTNLVNELLDKVELIKRKRPDLLRKKIIKVIYTDYAVPEAVEAAKNNNIWILRWEKDLTPLKISE